MQDRSHAAVAPSPVTPSTTVPSALTPHVAAHGVTDDPATRLLPLEGDGPPAMRVACYPASSVIAERLSANRPDWNGPSHVASERDRARVLGFLKRNGREAAKAAGLRWIETSGVHDVTFGAQPHGDLFVCDMLGVLHDFREGERVLDFGCSSGRVVRNLAATRPTLRCEGCDPRAASIALARSHVPEVEWFVSNEAPPLPDREADRYDLVFAISVWSHFAEGAALAWFREMARVVKPGGELIFSTHGARSIHHVQHVLGNMKPEAAEARRVALANGEVHFMRYRDSELNASWGMAFLPRRWVEANLAQDWTLRLHAPGLLMANQDVYVLRRKEPASRLRRIVDRLTVGR